MKKVYMLVPDYGYDGYGVPNEVWSNKPSKDDLMDCFSGYIPTQVHASQNLEYLQNEAIAKYSKICDDILEDKCKDYELVEYDVIDNSKESD